MLSSKQQNDNRKSEQINERVEAALRLATELYRFLSLLPQNHFLRLLVEPLGKGLKKYVNQESGR